MASSIDAQLEALCEVASAAATAKGHDLGAWSAEGEQARTATCRRCGRTIYVRIGEGMSGIAGAAFTTACD